MAAAEPSEEHVGVSDNPDPGLDKGEEQLEPSRPAPEITHATLDDQGHKSDNSDESSGEDDEEEEGEKRVPEWKIPPSKLPVHRKTLTALAKAQKDLQPLTREKVIQFVVEGTLVKKAGLGGLPVQYVLKRLITGVSTSFGSARPNYATILMRITKAHAKVSGPAAVDAIMDAVVAVYGDGGTFNANFARGLLEKTLGSLVATSAVVRGARNCDISVDAARKIIRILRIAVNGIANKWNLTPAVMDVLHELLDNIRNRDKMGDLMKQLWSWAEERSKMHDGLTVALLLLVEYEVVSAEAFRKLYPTFSDLGDPLMAMFDTGFPTPGLAEQGTEEIPELDDVPEIFVDNAGLPMAWALILRYFSTASAKAHIGGISVFWKDFVLPKLVVKVYSPEKQLLAALMLPAAVACLEEDEPHEYVLNKLSFFAVHKLAQFGAGRRKKFAHGKARDAMVNERLKSALDKVTENLVNVCTFSKLSVSRRASLSEYIIRWANVNGMLKLFTKAMVTTILGGLPEESIPTFFTNIAYFFLHPHGTVPKHKVKQPSRPLAHLREGYMMVLERAVAACPRLALPFMYIVILTALFVPKQRPSRPADQPENEPTEHIRDPYEPMVKVPETFKKEMAKVLSEMASDSFSTELPVPLPDIGPGAAGDGFKRLMDCLLSGHKPNVVAKRLEMAVKILDGAMKNGESMRIGLRNRALIEDLGDFNSSLELVMSKRSSFPTIRSCLALVGRYLKLSFYQPMPRPTADSADLKNISVLFSKCVRSLFEQPEGGGDIGASVLEQTAYMLCAMCSGDAKHGVVAKLGIELLGEIIDDSVTAVIFDMLDASKKGLLKRDDPDSSAESDDDSVMEMSVNDDEEIPGALNENGDGEIVDSEETPGEKMDTVDSDKMEGDIFDVDVDPDTEDPKVLAAFDKHLENHMKLLRQRKRLANRVKSNSEDRISKLFALIGTTANCLRLKVESKNSKCDQKTVAVFFDVFVRCQEFVLSDEYDASQYAKRVSAICDKYMSKKQVFVGALTDSTLVAEFGERIFSRVLNYRSGRVQISALSTAISRTATVIFAILAKSRGSGYKGLVEYYNKLWKMYLGGRSSHLSSNIFTGYADVSPAEAVGLTARAQEVFLTKDAGIRQRRRAMEGLNILHPMAVALHEEDAATAKTYWGRINSLGDSLSDKESESLWKDEVILKEFLEIIRAGERVGVITKFYSQTIFQLAHSNKMYGKLRRDITGMKRGLDAMNGEDADASGVQSKNKRKWKKAKNQPKK